MNFKCGSSKLKICLFKTHHSFTFQLVVAVAFSYCFKSVFSFFREPLCASWPPGGELFTLFENYITFLKIWQGGNLETYLKPWCGSSLQKSDVK